MRRLLATLTIASVVLMSGCKKDEYLAKVGICPVVVSTIPANQAVGIPLDQTISVTFNEQMNPATFTSESFILQGTAVIAGTKAATVVTGAFTFNDKTVIFTPSSPLTANTTFTGTVKTAVKDSTGNALQADFVWSFTTGLSPNVVTTDPLDNALGVVLNKVVIANFSVPMNPLTLTATTYTLKQGTTSIAGAVTYSGTAASFDPTVDLLPATVYTATITTGAKNAAGLPIAADYVWTFTTIAANVPTVTLTDPANNATGVVLNKTVTANFNMAMDPLTLSATSFTLKQGVNAIAGAVTYAGTTASLNPTIDLLPNTIYTATITTGAKSVAGVALSNDFVWSFTTGAVSTFIPVVDLKTAGEFGILAYTTVTNNAGPSVINNMDVGISPGVRSSVTGFPPATIVGGAIYAADDLMPVGTPARLTQAKLDLTAAYLFAEGATAPAPATVAGDQGGKTLAPGIYKSTSTLLVQNGNLTLDGQGDPNATWIFQIASDFTTVGGAGGSIILTGGAQAKNIFWQTGRSAVIGDNTSFFGNILALTSITMNSGATVTGRMLAQNGAVVMTNANTITKP